MVLVLPLILMVIIRLSLGFDGRYGQDPYAYTEYGIALKKFLTDGTNPGPFFWPVLYPAAGCLLSFIYPDMAGCLQFVSVLSLIVIIMYGSEIIRLIYPQQKISSFSYFFIFGLLSPYMFRLGLSVMSDSFSIALLMIGIFYTLKHSHTGNWKHILTGCLFLGLATMTRYAVGVICIPFLMFGFYTVWKLKSPLPKTFLMLIFLFIPTLPHLLLRQTEVMEFIRHPFVLNWSPINLFKRTFSTSDGHLQNILPNIMYSFLGLFHPRYFLLGLPFLLIGWRKVVLNKESQVIMVAFLTYLFFIGGIPFQNNRFLLPAYPLLLIICYPATLYSVSLLGQKIKPFLWSAIIIFQVILTTASLWPVWNRYQFEHQVISYCSALSPATIYSIDMDICLKGHQYQGKVNNLYSNFYEEVDSNSILIINPLNIHSQWKNTMPEQNINHFNSRYNLHEIRSFKNGWKIYRIE